MAVGRLLTIIVVVIILYLLISWFMSDGSSLLPSSYPLPANKAITIEAKKLKTGTANNFAMSCWFFVSNWDTHFGQEKVVYERIDSDGNIALKMALDKYENNLIVDVGTYALDCAPGNSGAPGSSSGSGCKKHQQCIVQNVPLQRWVNAIVSVYGRSLDIYIDGKLVRTCVLKNTAYVPSGVPMTVCPNGIGFGGQIANFKYFNDAKNPQEAWNIYADGFGGSVLSNLFNKYYVQVKFFIDDEAQGSFRI